MDVHQLLKMLRTYDDETRVEIQVGDKVYKVRPDKATTNLNGDYITLVADTSDYRIEEEK